MITLIKNYLERGYHRTIECWNRFWFSPRDPATYCFLRIFIGSVLLYSTFMWSFDLQSFYGADSWVTVESLELRDQLRGNIPTMSWNYLAWVSESPTLLWIAHLTSIAVVFCFTIGLFSRVTSVLTWIVVLTYLQRNPMGTYGVDQMAGILAFYMMLGPSGACYSVDAWLKQRREAKALDLKKNIRKRRGQELPVELSQLTPLSWSANLAIRFMQVHLCIVYLFAGLGKTGPLWLGGEAVWHALANLEFQTLDLTWLAHWPYLLNFITLAALFGELSYCALVWNRWLRPLVVLNIIGMHLGIGLLMGMMPFGLLMIFANLSWTPSWLVRSLLERKPLPSWEEIERKQQLLPELRLVDGIIVDTHPEVIATPPGPPHAKGAGKRAPSTTHVSKNA
ncbi:HTTM domain-containing protein [Planctomycetales bacterium 10988]|nr:HTTM domain-containing protein [Planctomycetales bacterium 10988]